jgi:hypothetical protein
MTEAEWLACKDPQELLRVLMDEKRSSVRKWHLFACACARRIWHMLKDERIRTVLEMGEQLADGLIPEKDIHDAWDTWLKDPAFFNGDDEEVAAFAASGISARWYFDDAQEYSVCAASGFQQGMIDRADPVASGELRVQEQLLRCVVGNPFQQSQLAATSLTPAITALAQSAYADRHLSSGHLDPTVLAILADALEDAGCTNAEALGHLRSPGPHVRGCWAVDLALGKE